MTGHTGIGRFLARRAVIVAVVGAAKKSTDSLVSERRLDSLKVPIVVQIKPIFSILVSLN